MAVSIRKVAPQNMQAEQVCLILDVRTEAEHAMTALQKEHIHLPLDRLQAREFMHEQQLDGGTPLYVLCAAGARATKAAEMFAQAGLNNVHVIEGGIQACKAAGLPLIIRPGMSLERQVRIVAGSLVLLACVLGTWVHPGFYGVAAVVGGGLVFAGITDWCGMAMLLAKAPWNRSSKRS